MKYYIEVGTVNKAKQDIDEICRREGFSNLTRHNFGKGGVGRFLTKLVSVVSILWTLKKGDVLFLQYPMKKFYYMACSLAKMKGAKVVTVIHDLGAFRRHKLTPEGENSRLSKTDFLIVHNPTMRDYLIEHGYKGGIHCLQIFDYLSEVPEIPENPEIPEGPENPDVLENPENPEAPEPLEIPALPTIVYAGNLGRWRNAFLYKMEPIMQGWRMDLYGKGFEATPAQSNAQPLPSHQGKIPHALPSHQGEGSGVGSLSPLTYHGFIASDDFIARVKADFGLVWDGDSLDECTGDWGEYLRINDPHKTSFYLRAGIPVIVWKEAAMAPFIEEQRVGISVGSLTEISKRIAALSPADYQEMKQNAVAMSRRLNNGYYIKAGLKAADGYLCL